MYRELTGIYEEVKTPAKAEPKPKKKAAPRKKTPEFSEQLKIDSEASAQTIADAANEPSVIKVESPFAEETKPAKKSSAAKSKKTTAKKSK